MGKLAIIGSTGHYEEKALPLKEKGIEIRYGDYQKDTFSPSVFEGAEKLLFISGLDQDSFKHIQDHMVVIDNARKAGIKHILYTSMAGAEKCQHEHSYVHIATENAIKASKIPYTILRHTLYLRLFVVQKDLKRAVDSGIFYSLSKGSKINLVTRDDLAKGAAVILTTEGHLNKTYDLTAPKAYTYKDICEDLAEVTGKKIEFVETTKEDYGAYLTSLGIPPQAQFFDSGFAQMAFIDGWAEDTTPDLANFIGEENITTPKKLIAEMDFS